MIKSMTRAGYETTVYTLISKTDSFEIRDYADAQLVSTSSMTDAGEMGDNFNQLFRYIGGYNRTKESIAMTTPVFISEQGRRQEMSFVLPSDTVVSGPPVPLVDSVYLNTMPAGRFAVLRYSGDTDLAGRERAEARLKAWLAEEDVSYVELPRFAFYDPPWTPAFMRRNEVLIRLSN